MHTKHKGLTCFLAAALCGLITFRALADDAAPAADSALDKPAPETVEDLQAIEEKVTALVERTSDCTVGLRIRNSYGSGVVVTGDGYILTAGHVSGEPGRRVRISFPDGTNAEGTTLGRNPTMDAGLIKINSDRTDWPHCPMGTMDSLELGQWCVTVGHPGGFREDRGPVYRLGRLIYINSRMIQTDCELIGGDSGGPLFDLEGNVIAIHSRIGPETEMNFHVPIGIYHDGWDRLVAGETFHTHSGALLGLTGEPDPQGLKVTRVWANHPASNAGIRVDDILVTYDGNRVTDIQELIDLVGHSDPGQEVMLELIRGGETIERRVRLGMRDD
jgi:serine protease Do